MHDVPARWKPLFRGPGHSTRPVDLVATAGFVLGGALLLWSAYIHFHLWHDEGYHAIGTIGPLFLLQSIAGAVLGVGVMAVRRVWAAALGLGFALTTVAGFLVTVQHGLFGFKDSWQAPFAHQAFAVELAAALVLGLAATLCLVSSAPRAAANSTPAGAAT